MGRWNDGALCDPACYKGERGRERERKKAATQL